jgi:hypothetical protein
MGSDEPGATGDKDNLIFNWLSSHKSCILFLDTPQARRRQAYYKKVSIVLFDAVRHELVAAVESVLLVWASSTANPAE